MGFGYDDDGPAEAVRPRGTTSAVQEMQAAAAKIKAASCSTERLVSERQAALDRNVVRLAAADARVTADPRTTARMVIDETVRALLEGRSPHARQEFTFAEVIAALHDVIDAMCTTWAPPNPGVREDIARNDLKRACARALEHFTEERLRYLLDGQAEKSRERDRVRRAKQVPR